MRNSRTIVLRVREDCPHYPKLPRRVRQQRVEYRPDLLHPSNLSLSLHMDLPTGLLELGRLRYSHVSAPEQNIFVRLKGQDKASMLAPLMLRNHRQSIQPICVVKEPLAIILERDPLGGGGGAGALGLSTVISRLVIPGHGLGLCWNRHTM